MSKRKRRPSPQRKPSSPSNIAADLKEIPPEVLKNLPEDTRIAIIQASSFKGPLPPPALYREYENILPGIAERLLKMTEDEQKNRHQIQDKLVSSSIKYGNRGQWMGFTIGMTALCATALCAYYGQTIPAFLLGGTSITGAVTAWYLIRQATR